MTIVESTFDLSLLTANISTDQLVLDVVCVDGQKHYLNNRASLLFFYFLSSDTEWCVPIEHNESSPLPGIFDIIRRALSTSIQRKYTFDKKSVTQLFGEDCGLLDIRLLRYLSTGTEDDDDATTNSHRFINSIFRNLPDTNKCIPLFKHARLFSDKVKRALPLNISMVDEPGLMFVNNKMTNCFARLESNGLYVTDDFVDEFGNEQEKHIKNGIIYSQYNLLTSTGRPSNRFGGINYAALNKSDNSRECFVSRYGNEGTLIMMDYSAFHPRLIAHLVNFPMDVSVNPYEYLARYYFNKEEINEEDIAVAKGFTFTQIYGGLSEKFLHIPLFAKIQEYINHRWKFFEENGYIETPKYRREIRACHIEDATPNKLFNYILQAFETEMAVDVLGELLDNLESKKTKAILYTYDSILFDVHKEDKIDTIRKIKNIMEQEKFPVKVYVGKSYKDMQHIKIS